MSSGDWKDEDETQGEIARLAASKNDSKAQAHGEDSPISRESNFKKFFKFAGPGFLVSIACLDPGNLSGDIALAQETRVRLVWVVILAHAMAYIYQSIALTVAIKTNHDIANLIRLTHPHKTSIFLWMMAELAVIGADTQEVIGTAVALKLMFGIPMSSGVILTVLISLGILQLQNYGQKLIEHIFAAAIAVMAFCFFLNYLSIGPSFLEQAQGLVPVLGRNDWSVALSLMGSVIMPQNLFLHSSLMQERDRHTGSQAEELWFYRLETKLIMTVSFFINLFVIGAFSHFSGKEELQLENAYVALTDVIGKVGGVIWAIGLFSSGQSGCIAGAITGQYLTEGFLQWKIKRSTRILLTRLLSLVPCIFIIFFSDLESANVVLNIVQFVQLPFVVIPAIKFITSKELSDDQVYYGWQLKVLLIFSTMLICMTTYQILENLPESLLGKTICIGLLFAYLIFLKHITTLKLRSISKTPSPVPSQEDRSTEAPEAY